MSHSGTARTWNGLELGTGSTRNRFKLGTSSNLGPSVSSLALLTPQPESGPGVSSRLWGMVYTWKSHRRRVASSTAAPPRPLTPVGPQAAPWAPADGSFQPPPPPVLGTRRAAPRTQGHGLLLPSSSGAVTEDGEGDADHPASVPVEPGAASPWKRSGSLSVDRLQKGPES